VGNSMCALSSRATTNSPQTENTRPSAVTFATVSLQLDIAFDFSTERRKSEAQTPLKSKRPEPCGPGPAQRADLAGIAAFRFTRAVKRPSD